MAIRQDGLIEDEYIDAYREKHGRNPRGNVRKTRMDDAAKPTADKLAFQMQMKAFQKEPDNPLYAWACAFSNDDRARSFALAAALLSADSPWPGWLKAKGFPGRYILEALVYCQEQHEQRA
jgi:hypothetical protein